MASTSESNQLTASDTRTARLEMRPLRAVFSPIRVSSSLFMPAKTKVFSSSRCVSWMASIVWSRPLPDFARDPCLPARSGSAFSISAKAASQLSQSGKISSSFHLKRSSIWDLSTGEPPTVLSGMESSFRVLYGWIGYPGE